MTTTIVFLDRATLPPATVLRAPAFAHRMLAHDRTAPDQVAARIGGAEIVITNKVRIGAEVLAACPGLKLIAVAATGTDVIDLAAARAQGVVVSNIRGYAVHTVPEHTFALILALRRSILPYSLSVQHGRWPEAQQFCYFDYPIRDLAGSTLGLIGHGALGGAVAGIARAFGMQVLVAGRKGQPATPGTTPFDEVLARADVISLHAPLQATTRNLISDAEFAQMVRRPLIINTARGGIVDEAALVRAVISGQVAGAGFDVVSTEPLPADHVFHQILGRPNVILTPHVAWASAEATQGLADQLMDNLEAFMAGAPRNVL